MSGQRAQQRWGKIVSTEPRFTFKVLEHSRYSGIREQGKPWAAAQLSTSFYIFIKQRLNALFSLSSL